MQYTKFNDEIQLSRLGMGVMRLPVHPDKPGTPINYEKSQDIIDYAIEKGVNYFDTAYIYHNGESEVFLGKALSKYPRDSYYLADKFNAMANPDYVQQFEEQLTRLNTDYIDFYLIHGVQDAFIDEIIESGCIEYFEKLQAAGKIRYFGFSFHGSPKGLWRLQNLRYWDFAQIQLNYYDWVYSDADMLYDTLALESTPIMVMEPVRGGRLASLTPETNAMLLEAEPERTIASWAMRWLMNLPAISVVLSGMSDMAQLVDNIDTFSEHEPLNESQKKILAEALERFRPAVTVACTRCRYCCNACPKGLDIPGILTVYNEVKLDDVWRMSFLGNLPADSQPDACIGCGFCTKHCPQGINIPAHIKELAVLGKQMAEMWRDKGVKSD